MLFDALATPALNLKNRMVMSPLTRSRAVERNCPNALMVEYYRQRASAGLIITEGTSPSINGLGYANIPGICNDEQEKGWQAVVSAVHEAGGKMVMQLMHTGRVTHVANLPSGGEVMGPMAEACPGEIFTLSQGLKPHTAPRAMSAADIEQVVKEFTEAAQRAIRAGFDGVELHAANGYLIEQFLNPNVNGRTDGYGGSISGRNRLALDIARSVVAAIGANKVGIRLSPCGVFNSTGGFAEVEPQYLALVRELSALGLLYIHVLDHSAMGAPAVPESLKRELKQQFKGLFILAGGFDRDTAETALTEKKADLIAFGRSFLANPDLVQRFKLGAPLNVPDMETFYTSDAKGYTDYPSLP
ncbi:MAG: alkene reductase [Betaproteobacteria bacterium]|jgi:N-ethylmaleimide reductase